MGAAAIFGTNSGGTNSGGNDSSGGRNGGTGGIAEDGVDNLEAGGLFAWLGR